MPGPYLFPPYKRGFLTKVWGKLDSPADFIYIQKQAETQASSTWMLWGSVISGPAYGGAGCL